MGVCAALLHLKKNVLMLTGFIGYLHVFFSFCSKNSYPFWQTIHWPPAWDNRRGVSSFAEGRIPAEAPTPFPVAGPKSPSRPQNAVTFLSKPITQATPSQTCTTHPVPLAAAAELIHSVSDRGGLNITNS